jgi:hypothetical protein
MSALLVVDLRTIVADPDPQYFMKHDHIEKASVHSMYVQHFDRASITLLAYCWGEGHSKDKRRFYL